MQSQHRPRTRARGSRLALSLPDPGRSRSPARALAYVLHLQVLVDLAQDVDARGPCNGADRARRHRHAPLARKGGTLPGFAHSRRLRRDVLAASAAGARGRGVAGAKPGHGLRLPATAAVGRPRGSPPGGSKLGTLSVHVATHRLSCSLFDSLKSASSSPRVPSMSEPSSASLSASRVVRSSSSCSPLASSSTGAWSHSSSS